MSAERASAAEVLRKLGIFAADRMEASAAAGQTAERPETAWPAHMKRVSAEARRQLSVEVLSIRLGHVYDSTDRDLALFEIESSQGLIQAILSRSGECTFFWKR